jgi:hypothetical protein
MGFAAGATAQQGEAIEYFECASANNGHNECRYNSTGVVTVHVNRQMSKSPCTFNESWGTWDGGVWVDYGCRAEFVVRRPPQTANYNPRPIGGTLKTINCESRGNSYQVCPLDGFDFRSVTIERQLSSTACNRGTTWGVSSGENGPPGIWVDRGCRATFAYKPLGDSHNPYGGTPHDFELPCESLRGEWNHCEVPSAHLARVDLIAGNSECNAYKAWGVDDTGVWVRSNCQGAFRVRYRH